MAVEYALGIAENCFSRLISLISPADLECEGLIALA
jgi:hypothetical protein